MLYNNSIENIKGVVNMDDLEILFNNEDQEDFIKLGWGHSAHYITRKQLNDVIRGGKIFIYDGEYTHEIILKEL